jgi:hypothetical protein
VALKYHLGRFNKTVRVQIELLGSVESSEVIEEQLRKIPLPGRQLNHNPKTGKYERCAPDGRFLSDDELHPPLKREQEWMVEAVNTLQRLHLITKPVQAEGVSSESGSQPAKDQNRVNDPNVATNETASRRRFLWVRRKNLSYSSLARNELYPTMFDPHRV